MALAACSDDGGSPGDGADASTPDASHADAAHPTDASAHDTSTPIDAGADTGPVADAGHDAPTGPVAKRIIFFLGDGMGISVMTAARIYAVGEAGSLTMDTLPETGYVRTFSKDSQVTDSAAAMTAYMTGKKVQNDVLSMSEDTVYKGTNGTPVATIFEMAEKAGWATGVVTTTRVTHATPAACFAHINERDLEDAIATQVVPGGAGYNAALGDGLEVLLGGGQKQFLPTASGGGRTDGRDLVAELKAKGYAYASDKAGLAAIPASATKIAGLFTGSHMAYELDRNAAKEPSLAEMSIRALDVLAKNDKGSILMIEGGRIDHALHETNAKRALVDTVAFDDAIKAVLAKVTLTDPKLENTLIVVTADHDHTMVLNGYAKRTGPTSAQNAGVLGLVNNVVTGAPDLDADGRPYSILGFGNGENRVAGNRSSAAALTEAVTSANDYHQEAAIRMPVGGETHGGTDVAIMAKGMGAEAFHGFMNNTEVFTVLKSTAGL